MYKGSLSLKKEFIIHLLFWVIWTYYSIVVIENNAFRIGELPLFYITGIIVYVLTFYVNYLFVLPKVFNPFRWRKAIWGFVIVFLFFTLSRYLVEQVITFYWLNTRNYTGETNIPWYLYDNILYSSKPIILSTVLWTMIFLVRTLEYNKVILEENKNTEIKFLKAQINPHFVFNTLNNIYSMVYFKSDKSLPAIEKLSQIMQFTTYESQKEKIQLSGEINYILAYIELEQLRHEEDAFTDLTLDTSLNEMIEIPPYILSPLVENALKHGVMSNADPIRIELIADKQHLNFRVENTIGTQKKDKLGGIGLDNLRKRLEIYYPDSHSLQITNENNRFTAELNIAFK